MRVWRRLCRGEEGQVLYMTLIMMLLLVAFTLVLVNVLYIGVMKVKAQNAADQLALSGATVKARVLNQATNLNGLLYILRWFGNVNETVPYATIGETGVACGLSFGILGVYIGLVETAHNHTHGDH